MVDFTKILDGIANQHHDKDVPQPTARDIDTDKEATQPQVTSPVEEGTQEEQVSGNTQPPPTSFFPQSQPDSTPPKGCRSCGLKIILFFFIILIINFFLIFSFLRKSEILPAIWNAIINGDENAFFENADSLFKKYQEEALQGDPEAQYNLAFCYESGQGVTPNQQTAFHWYKESAEQGYPLAQYEIANRYETGSGTTKNIQSAIFWFNKAKESGILQAAKKLEELNSKGTPSEQNSEKSLP